MPPVSWRAVGVNPPVGAASRTSGLTPAARRRTSVSLPLAELEAVEVRRERLGRGRARANAHLDLGRQLQLQRLHLGPCLAVLADGAEDRVALALQAQVGVALLQRHHVARAG